MVVDIPDIHLVEIQQVLQGYDYTTMASLVHIKRGVAENRERAVYTLS